MNKKAISILLTAAMGVSVLAAGTVTVSAACLLYTSSKNKIQFGELKKTEFTY